MKAFTPVSAMLGLLSTPAMATEPVKSQFELSVGGVNFKASRFTDGRSTPYRVYFWDEHIEGSSYRFSRSGHLEYFKAGSEVYYDRTEKDGGSLTFKTKKAKESGGRHENKMPMDQRLPTCADCVDDLAAVCGSGLPAFCSSYDEAHLGYAGAYSAGILCRNYEDLCDTLQDGCDAICIAELEHTSTCDNGFIGVQASNGACCDAGCGPRCGGVGCSTFGQELGLDQDDCCATEIVDYGRPCSETGEAPCFIDDGSDQGSGDQGSRDVTTCDNGFIGVQASNGACCDAGCGPQCGGVGCSSFGQEFGLDQDDCCATEIVDFGKPCSEAGKAPCFIDDSNNDDLGGVILGSNAEVSKDGGSMDAECNRTSLDAADLEALDVYDFDMYIEPGCVETTEHLLNGCNFMGLAQECRGCYETCEGALYYIEMHQKEIEEKGEDVIINFCPDSGLSSLDECR